MKILLTSIGTRGDMEPFLAIGELLRKRGHRVLCLFPEQFRDLAEDSGFEFASLGSAFIELLNSPAGRLVMGGGGMSVRKLRAYGKLISVQSSVSKEMIRQQQAIIDREQPDRIVCNGKTLYPVIWGLDHPGQTVLISPVPYMHYVKEQAHVFFHRDFGPFLNKLTYRLANFGLIKTIMSSLKWLDLPRKIRQKEIQAALFGSTTIYTISPTLFPRPEYWPDHLHVLGYHERDKTTHWHPTAALEAFLQRHEKIVCVTFGSMVNNAPMEKTRILLDVLTRNRIPAIVNTAAGGLVEPDAYDTDLLHFVSRVPYDWLFPRMYAVVHHGGSGTTHMALKYGCASLILPHIIDQYAWNTIIADHGAGPLGIDISKINRRNLEGKLLNLWQKAAYKTTAEALGRQLRAEDYREQLCTTIVGR